MQHKSSAPCLVLKKTSNGPVLHARNVEPPQGGKGMLDKTPADSGSRERALGWLFEELQLDEVMVFVAKLVNIFGGLWDL